jgi:hypothetical protein
LSADSRLRLVTVAPWPLSEQPTGLNICHRAYGGLFGTSRPPVPRQVGHQTVWTCRRCGATRRSDERGSGHLALGRGAGVSSGCLLAVSSGDEVKFRTSRNRAHRSLDQNFRPLPIFRQPVPPRESNFQPLPVQGHQGNRRSFSCSARLWRRRGRNRLDVRPR